MRLLLPYLFCVASAGSNLFAIPPWDKAFIDDFEYKLLFESSPNEAAKSLQQTFNCLHILKFLLPNLLEIQSFRKYAVKVEEREKISAKFIEGKLTEEAFVTYPKEIERECQKIYEYVMELQKCVDIIAEYENYLRRKSKLRPVFANDSEFTLERIFKTFGADWKKFIKETEKAGGLKVNIQGFQILCGPYVETDEYDKCRISLIAISSNMAVLFSNYKTRAQIQLRLLEDGIENGSLDHNFIKGLNNFAYNYLEHDVSLNDDLMAFYKCDLKPFMMTLYVGPRSLSSMEISSCKKGTEEDTTTFEQQLVAKLENLLPFVHFDLRLKTSTKSGFAQLKRPRDLLQIFHATESYFLGDQIDESLVQAKISELPNLLASSEVCKAREEFQKLFYRSDICYILKTSAMNADLEMDIEATLALLRKYRIIGSAKENEANVTGIVFDEIEEEKFYLSMEEYIGIAAQTLLFNGLIVSDLGPPMSTYVSSKPSWFRTIDIICEHSRLSDFFVAVVPLQPNSLLIKQSSNQPGLKSPRDYVTTADNCSWKQAISSRTISVPSGLHLHFLNSDKKDILKYVEDRMTPIMVIAAIARIFYQRFSLPMDSIAKCILCGATPVAIRQECFKKNKNIDPEMGQLCIEKPRLMAGRFACDLTEEDFKVPGVWKGRAKYGMGVFNYAGAIKFCQRQLSKA